jgi:hypothetical protein
MDSILFHVNPISNVNKLVVFAARLDPHFIRLDTHFVRLYTHLRAKIRVHALIDGIGTPKCAARLRCDAQIWVRATPNQHIFYYTWLRLALKGLDNPVDLQAAGKGCGVVATATE